MEDNKTIEVGEVANQETEKVVDATGTVPCKQGCTLRPQKRKKLGGVALIVCGVFIGLCIGLGGGYTLRQKSEPTPTQGGAELASGMAPINSTVVGNGKIALTFEDNKLTRESVTKLGAVFRMLKGNYYRELTDEEIVLAMTKGACNFLDSPHTYYMTSEIVTSVQDSMAGEYSGIGAIVSQNTVSKLYEISEIFENSPAYKAKINQGDVIQAVDGKDVRHFNSVTELATVVRGKEGTEVELTLYRPSSQETMKVRVIRGRITNASIRTKLIDSNVGYIRVTEFSQGIADKFEQGLTELKNKGAQSYIIDLRSNTGGRADECIKMLDLFLAKDTKLASIEGRMDNKSDTETWTATKDVLIDDKTKVAILLNRYSASASELFSGCLRDYGRATLVGEKTYGKGTGTRQFDLDDGSAIQVTMFRYFLPKGECVEGVGMEPEYKVAISAEAETKPIGERTVAEDAQLQKALEVVKP